MSKIAVVGSRDFPYLNLVEYCVGSLPPDTVVVSGGARGVDRTAENAARGMGLEVLIFPAEWDKYGKRAGYLRNETIVKEADIVYIFWDGESRGTSHVIDLCRKTGKTAYLWTTFKEKE